MTPAQAEQPKEPPPGWQKTVTPQHINPGPLLKLKRGFKQAKVAMDGRCGESHRDILLDAEVRHVRDNGNLYVVRIKFPDGWGMCDIHREHFA